MCRVVVVYAMQETGEWVGVGVGVGVGVWDDGMMDGSTTTSSSGRLVVGWPEGCKVGGWVGRGKGRGKQG